MQAALELNPFGSWYSGLHPQYLLFAGEKDAALAAGRDAIRRFPAIDYAYSALSQTALPNSSTGTAGTQVRRSDAARETIGV